MTLFRSCKQAHANIVKEYILIDKENGYNLCWDVIMKEMKNVRPALEVFEKHKKDIPIGYQQIKCHMIFDVKIGEKFRRKARLVGGGHTGNCSRLHHVLISCIKGLSSNFSDNCSIG